MVNGHVPVATTPLASVTLTVNVPLDVGVPVIAPVVEFRVRPAGSVPVAIENVKGDTPPVTVIAGLLNATPTSPEVTAEQATDGAATMVKGQVPAAATPLASVTLIVNAPLEVGVPVIAPVVEFRLRPAGSVPVATENVYGAVPPVTVIAGLLNASPTSPELTVEQVTVGGGTMVKGQLPVATTPLASLTWMVKVPAAVGVPVIAPVEAFKLRPAGRVPVATANV
jgi:hypothetical protein